MSVSPPSYPPSPEFSAKAHVRSMEEYRALYERAEADPEAFWGELAGSELDWFEKWTRVLDWDNPPFAKWFSGGKTNVCYNCVDRHAERAARQTSPPLSGKASRAISASITFAELKVWSAGSRMC